MIEDNQCSGVNRTLVLRFWTKWGKETSAIVALFSI